ncbi:MAG TPA: hypothetical protein VM187_14065 [Niastella sp.]|nr:hypothetical protein [Niastella sp.]
MNQLKFYGSLLCAASTLFLSSCNNADNSSSETTTTDSATTTADAPVNTIVTTPENIMAVRHKVADYNKWLAGFESADSLKAANGLHNYVIGRSVDDTSMLLVATKADDIAKAKAFGNSAELKARMKETGVTGKPQLNYITTVYQDTGKIGTDLRAMTMVTVKDWDAWKTAFEGRRQDRIDAGLTDRVYGYDPDDNHKVTIVVAVTDTAKANAFWNSDKLKQDMAKGGVVGKPERFVFRVTKRY